MKVLLVILGIILIYLASGNARDHSPESLRRSASGKKRRKYFYD